MSTNQSEVLMKPVINAKKVMLSLAQLANVQESLATLIKHNIVKPEAMTKGCKKFINEHPEINEYLASKIEKLENVHE